MFIHQTTPSPPQPVSLSLPNPFLYRIPFLKVNIALHFPSLLEIIGGRSASTLVNHPEYELTQDFYMTEISSHQCIPADEGSSPKLACIQPESSQVFPAANSLSSLHLPLLFEACLPNASAPTIHRKPKNSYSSSTTVTVSWANFRSDELGIFSQEHSFIACNFKGPHLQ